MAGTTVERILGAPNLIGLIQGSTDGLPTSIMPAGFFPGPGNIIPCEGDKGTFTRVYGNKQLATQVAFGSPARKRSLIGVEDVDVRCIHTFEEVNFKPTDLQNLLAEGDTARQNLGAQTVARQIAGFKSMFTNLRIAALYSALFKGYIWFDSGGALLSSSSSAAVTIDMQIPATHQNQISTKISASWATDGTDVIGDIEAIKQFARTEYGAELKYAFYGTAVPEYLQSNTALKALVGGSFNLSEQVAKGMVPSYGGLTWIPGSSAYYQTGAGVDTALCATDTVVFTPEPGPDWLGWIEGSYPIPTNLGISGDAASVLSSLTQVQGMFAYAAASLNPPGVTMYVGDTFLPVIKAPKAIFIADVVA